MFSPFVLENIYFFCLITGSFFILGSLIIGHLGDTGNPSDGMDSTLAHSVDPGHNSGDIDNTSNNSSIIAGIPGGKTNSVFFDILKFINPMAWSIFLFWFGLVGSIGIKLFSVQLAFILLIPAIIIGYLGVFIYQQIIRFMVNKMTVTNAFSRADLVGTIGKASLNITSTGFGEIVYSYHGQKSCSPAMAKIKGDTINKGDRIIIVDFKNNHFLVEKYIDENGFYNDSKSAG